MTRRGAATREAILDASRGLLVREGAPALSLRRVAGGAGISLGNLQHHFATLSALLDALLARELSVCIARVSEMLTEAQQGALSGVVIEVVLAEQNEEGIRLFAAIWALSASQPALRPVVREFYKNWIDQLAAALLAASPGMRSADAQQRASLFVACVEGISLFRSGLVASPGAHFTLGVRALLESILAGRLGG